MKKLLRWTASPLRLTVGILLLGASVAAVRAAEVSLLLSSSPTVFTGDTGSVWLVALNPGSTPVTHRFEATLAGTLTGLDWSQAATLELVAGEGAEAVLAPGGFARREYRFPLPRRTAGEVEVAISQLAGTRAIVQVDTPRKLDAEGLFPTARPAPTVATAPETSASSASFPPERSVERFFKAHFLPYEPMYFIAGFDQPNAKFQISFKYRIFNQDGWVSRELPALSSLHAAYTQTSLWDWEGESAPFRDSSYKPELHHAWHDVFRTAGSDGWFRFDLEGGVQHESNGRPDPDSRSINIAYLRPRVVFGRTDGFQFTLAPRAWAYIGEVQGRHDALGNPLGEGLEHYRGYLDVRATVGWEDNVMLSAYVRVGDSFERANLTLDATYPLSKLPFGTFAGYFHVQYFTGYGESLLDYDVRSETVRVGFSLWR